MVFDYLNYDNLGKLALVCALPCLAMDNECVKVKYWLFTTFKYAFN